MRRTASRQPPVGNAKYVPEPIRTAVALRSRGRCEAEHPGCTGVATQMHHMLMRSQGGRHLAVNLLHVCAWGHRYIHDHPAWSYERGYLIRGAGVVRPSE